MTDERIEEWFRNIDDTHPNPTRPPLLYCRMCDSVPAERWNEVEHESDDDDPCPVLVLREQREEIERLRAVVRDAATAGYFLGKAATEPEP